MLKAIVFDFDGTIIDTETAWFKTFCELYEEHGVELKLELYAQCIGTTHHLFDPYRHLIDEHGVSVDPAAFRDSVRARHLLLMEKESLREGILPYLQQAKAAGLRIGLATSSERAWVDRFLPQLGIADYFDCISTADDVARVKPDPELYVRTLECLGVAPDEAVAVEDSPNGAKAALAAGMHCIVVPNEVTRALEFEAAGHKADSLSELAFESLVAELAGK